MKRFRYLLAIVLAFAMTFGNVMPALAAPLTVDSQISVTDLQENDEVSYYKILEFSSDPTEAPKGWKLAAGFTALELNGKTGKDAVAEILDGITQDEANTISALAASATAVNSAPMVVGDNGTWSVANPDAGLYMVLVTAKTAAIVYNPAFVGADYYPTGTGDGQNQTNTISITATYGPNAIAKKTTINGDKTTEDAAAAVATAISSKVGATVPFHINTTVPVFLSSYTNPTFKITDSVTSGIEGQDPGIAINTDSIKVFIDDVETAAAGVYTIDPKTATGFTITFDTAWLKANVAAKSVRVDYTGTITNEATFNVNPDENDITIEFSNGPDDETGAFKDITNHYTFSIGAPLLGTDSIQKNKKTYELVKVGVDEEGEYVVEPRLVSDLQGEEEEEVGALAGAEFGLYTDSECTTLYTNSLYPDGATFTTGDDGIINFNGLAEGTYYLKEISAPAGFIKDTTAHTVVIAATYKTVSVAAYTDANGVPVAAYDYEVLDNYTVTIDGQNVSTYTMTNDGPKIVINETETNPDINMTEVNNTKGVELPSTGGIGTTIFYVVGGAMVVCGIVMLITKRRLSQMEK